MYCFEGLSKNGIGVIFVNNKNVLIPCTLTYREPSRLVGIDLACLFDGSKNIVGRMIVGFLLVVIVTDGLVGFSGEHMFACLVHVAHCSGRRLG